MWTGKPQHLKAFDYLGLHRYFLTFCTCQRGRLFTAPERVACVREQFLRAADAERFAIPAYCFMPDHVHLLAEGLEDRSDCRDFIARAKQLSGFYYKQMFGEQLWQRYGYERTLRDHESTLSVARYIVENPVRAKLVERPQDYPFSGAAIYSLQDILEAVQLRSDWDEWSG